MTNPKCLQKKIRPYIPGYIDTYLGPIHMSNIYSKTSESSRAKTKKKQGRWRRKKVLASLLSVDQVEAAVTTDSHPLVTNEISFKLTNCDKTYRRIQQQGSAAISGSFSKVQYGWYTCETVYIYLIRQSGGCKLRYNLRTRNWIWIVHYLRTSWRCGSTLSAVVESNRAHRNFESTRLSI